MSAPRQFLVTQITLVDFIIIGTTKAGTTSLYREDIHDLEKLLAKDL